MEIILIDQSYSGEEEEEKFIKELEKDIKEFDENAKWESADIGTGADWPVIILTIYSAVMSTISAIPELLNGAKKAKAILLKVGDKYGRLRFNEDCSESLAINYIIENESRIKKIEKILKKNIVVDPPVRDEKTGNLSDNPDAYYFQIYHILLDDENEFGECTEKYYFFIIKSDGKFELSHVLKIPKRGYF